MRISIKYREDISWFILPPHIYRSRGVYFRNAQVFNFWIWSILLYRCFEKNENSKANGLVLTKLLLAESNKLMLNRVSFSRMTCDVFDSSSLQLTIQTWGSGEWGGGGVTRGFTHISSLRNVRRWWRVQNCTKYTREY